MDFLLAPGTYSPGNVVVNTAPKFSFGVRTHAKVRNDNPGKHCCGTLHALLFLYVCSFVDMVYGLV